MRVFIIFLLTLSAQFCFSQEYGCIFYVVNDPDGWANVRNEKKEIIDRLNNNRLVVDLFGSDNEEWIDVEYSPQKDEVYASGLIHKSRLKPLTSLTKIPISAKNANSYSFKNNLLEVTIQSESFDLTGRTLKYSDEGSWLETIDGNYIWGVDGGMPHFQFKNIEVKQNNKKVYIPQSAFVNLFEPNLFSFEVFYNEDTDAIYITSLNGDGAGGYIATWTIEQGKYKERFVTHGF